MSPPRTYDDLGKKNGRYDMDRVGLFSEMPYLNGGPYLRKKPDDIRRATGSQMYSGGPKTKHGLQDVYFDKQFKRLFENEKWRQSYKTNARNQQGKNIHTTPFLPSSSAKRHSTPGDYYGTFGPIRPAMSPLKKPLPKTTQVPSNFVTAPTNTRGPGYADIGFSPYPEYMSSPYDDTKRTNKKKDNTTITKPFLISGPMEYFDKNPYFTDDIKPPYKKIIKKKFEGAPFVPPSRINNIGNGLDKWPVHSNDRYIDPYKIETGRNVTKDKNKNNSIGVFYPQTRNKSFYTISTMQRKLKSNMNNLNWRTFEPVTFTSIINRDPCL